MEKAALQSFNKTSSSKPTELSPQNIKDTTIVELALNSELSNSQSNSEHLSIKESVAQCMEQYFAHLGDQDAKNLYQMVINEVEPALLKSVLKHTGGNQSKAAEALGLNRGTLRKKLQLHGID